MNAYPRILCVDAATFTETTNMGILKKNLFTSWPKSCIAQVIIGNGVTEFEVCENNWRLDREAFLKKGPGRLLENPGEGGEGRGKAAPPGRSNLRQKLQPAANAYSDYRFSKYDVRANDSLMNWAKRYNPDVIFTFGASITLCKTAALISEELGVPVVPYYTDDWITHLYASSPYKYLLREKLCSWHGRMLRRVPVGLATCELMAEEYKDRYATQFVPCTDSVDFARYGLSEKKADSSRGIKFCYIGVLEPQRWRVLRKIAGIVQKMRDSGIDCAFHIYTMPRDAQLYSGILNLGEHVRIKGTLAHGEVPGMQSSSDVLVHVESFIKGLEIAKTRLSFSTKIPQYLAAGRPILAVGPANVSSIQHLKRSGAALVVDSDDEQLLKEAIERLVGEENLRHRLGEAGRKFCEENHDRSVMAKVFKDCVETAIRKFRSGPEGARA